MKTKIIILLILSPIFACMSNKNLKLSINKRHTQFGVQAIPEHWQQKSFRGADLYFEHSVKQATMFFSSQCEQFSDSPLEALSAQLLVGFTDIAVKKQERLKLAEREALVSNIEAKIDGVPRFLKIMVLRKNRCVFDGIFSSSPSEAELAQDFDTIIASFWAEAKL